MPSNILDEETWATARRKAAEAGHPNDYAYINALYQKLGGRFTSSGEDMKKALPIHTAALARLSTASRVPGQVPRKSIDPSLGAMPPEFKATMRLQFDGPVLTLQGVTRDLGMDLTQQRAFQKVIDDAVSTSVNEVALRQRLGEVMRLKSDVNEVQRRAIMQRALSFYRTRTEKSMAFIIDEEKLQKASGEGSKGGHIIGHTSSGKPIYERHNDATVLEYAKQHVLKGKSISAAAKATAKALHGGENVFIGPGVSHIDAKKLEHSIVASLHAHASPGGAHMANAWMTQNHFKLSEKDMARLEAHKPDVVQKAEPRGGTYHRRVTDPETGKHRYYYSEDDYAKRPDAHVSGNDAKKARAKKALEEHLSSGERDVDSLKLLADKHDAQHLTDLVKEGVTSGRYLHKDGKLSLKKSRDTTGAVEGASMQKSAGEGSRGGHVIGHTASGKPIYEGNAEHGDGKPHGHEDYSKQDHSDAARAHEKMANQYMRGAGISDAIFQKKIAHHLNVSEKHGAHALGGFHAAHGGEIASAHSGKSSSEHRKMAEAHAQQSRYTSGAVKTFHDAAAEYHGHASTMKQHIETRGSRDTSRTDHVHNANADRAHAAATKMADASKKVFDAPKPFTGTGVDFLKEIGFDTSGMGKSRDGVTTMNKAYDCETDKGLDAWLSKNGYPGDGGAKSDHAKKDGSGMQAGKVDMPDVVSMHEGTHGKDSNDDSGLTEKSFAVLDAEAEDAFQKSYGALVDGDTLQKAGPYVGPHGGKWADPEHKIPWDEKKHAGKPAPKAKPHNSEDARELILYAENHGDLHRQQHEPIRRNLVNKMADGKYDHAQATKLYGHMMENASKLYAKEMGGKSGHQFDPATRAAAAKHFADNFAEEAKAGDHDHLLNKKNQAAKQKSGAKSAYHHGNVGGSTTDSKSVFRAPTSQERATFETIGGAYKDGHHDHVMRRHFADAEEAIKDAATFTQRGEHGEAALNHQAAADAFHKIARHARDEGDRASALARAREHEQKRVDAERKTEKSMNGLNALGDWLQKAGIPGASDEGTGKPRDLSTGEPRKQMDERSGNNVEVSRAEDGGKVDGVGANSGAPSQGGASGIVSGASGKDAGKLDRLSEDDPPDTDEMKKKLGLVEDKNVTPSNGLQVGKSRDYNDLDNVTRPVLDDRDARRRAAAGVAALRKSRDVVVGVGHYVPENNPTEKKQYHVMQKGLVLMTDISDQRTMDVLEKGDGFWNNGAPTLTARENALVKSVACPTCGQHTPTMFASCQQCGASLSFQKSQATSVVERSGHRPMRAPRNKDVYLPNGVTNEE